jgi:hypothetical protein
LALERNAAGFMAPGRPIIDVMADPTVLFKEKCGQSSSPHRRHYWTSATEHDTATSWIRTVGSGTLQTFSPTLQPCLPLTLCYNSKRTPTTLKAKANSLSTSSGPTIERPRLIGSNTATPCRVYLSPGQNFQTITSTGGRTSSFRTDANVMLYSVAL